MFNRWLSSFRRHLANDHALLPLSFLGILSGFSSALVILLFRYMIDTPSTLWLPGNDKENFEALPQWLHFSLPVAGAIIMGIILRKMHPDDIKVGIPHVITRLHAYHGNLPLKNALVQFFAGAFAIITGQSGGREGPAIHIGAAANSLLGRRLALPNNSMRMLVACGTSAAIAASFDTPIAGVIFAMEVIMLEYTVASFIPVMLATVTATALSHAIYGREVLFSVPPMEATPLWELPYVAMMGLVIGSLAALFIVMMKTVTKHIRISIFNRFLLAGLITGLCALAVPQVLGLGYDSLNAALAGELGLGLLLALAATKLLTTSVGIGLGLPVGMIGPILLIGACLGSAMGALGATVYPAAADHHSFYVLLGMGAMMGAVLNAPLAGLMALLELSGNIAIIFPGMLAITIATLTTSEIFQQRSAHQTILELTKQSLPTDPVSLALQRTGVSSIMHREVITIPERLYASEAQKLMVSTINYFVIRTDKLQLIRRRDLSPILEKALNANPDRAINLLEIGLPLQPLEEIYIQATLWEAMDTMDRTGLDAMYVQADNPNDDHGIITRKLINNYFRASTL